MIVAASMQGLVSNRMRNQISRPRFPCDSATNYTKIPCHTITDAALPALGFSKRRAPDRRSARKR